MLKPTYPYYLANEPHGPNADLEVTDKFTGEVVTCVAMASPAVIDQAIAAAVAAVEPMGMLAAYERQDILYHCVKRFEERFEELRWCSALRPTSRSRTPEAKPHA